SKAISAWGNALGEDADILLYGCNIAVGEDGRNLTDTLAELTGADVAASDDLTGHQSLGGDWDLEVQVGDIESGPLIDQQAQQLWVNALAPPTAADNTITTHEDTTYTFTAANFNYSDADGEAMVSVQVTSLETVGALQFNGADVILNQVITKAEIDNDLLTFTSAADGNGTSYDSFGFSVNDGTSDSASTYTMTMDVISVNDAPVFANLDDTPAFTEDGAAQVLDLDVTIADSELDALNSGNGDYNGASVTLVRNGGVSADDVFSFTTANGISLSGSNLIKNTKAIASFDTTTTPGELVITFTNANLETPTSADVDYILQQITYENSSDGPPASVQIDWTFADGNTAGSQGTIGGAPMRDYGSTTVTITGVEDSAPVAVADTFIISAGVPVTIDPVANDTNTDNDSLTISIIDTEGGDVTTILTNPDDTVTLASGTVIELRADGRLKVTSAASESFNYTINDGTTDSNEVTITLTVGNDQATAEATGFVTTWQTDNPGTSASDTITIPIGAGDTDFTVFWGDGTSTDYTGGPATHTYASAGTYTVAIVGDFPGVNFNAGSDGDKLLSVEQWGNIAWQDLNDAFDGAENLVINASDAPDLSGVTNLSEMFRDATSINQDISGWDTSSVTN
ncbi:MAG: DUF4347 domain-containing protein, partial [bacterium]|nr:DUF4347 domain-containing protein [bacterium]